MKGYITVNIIEIFIIIKEKMTEELLYELYNYTIKKKLKYI